MTQDQEKHCTECGQALSAGAKFCSGCGRPVGSGSGRESGQTSSGGNWRRDGIIVVAIIIVVVGGYFAVRETQAPASSGEVTSPANHEGMGAALENVPTDYGGLIAGGNQHMDDGNFPVAAEMYKRALEIDGSSPDVRTDFGACLHAMGLPERALEEFGTVYREHPEHGIVRYNMGIVHYGQGQLDSARFYWEEYLRVSPNGGAAESARTYLEEIGS